MLTISTRGTAKWKRLTAAYGAAARRHGSDRAGANTARILRGAAAADAAHDDLCNEPVTVGRCRMTL